MAQKQLLNGFYTPLRYPGGKAKLANYVANLIRLNDMVGGTYVEPYAGGAAVAMELLLTGLVRRIHINDLSPAIYAFWHSVLFDTDKLCSRINRGAVTVNAWTRQRNVQVATDPDLIDLGYSTFFLNRTNRSGILNGGVIGGKNQDGPWKIDARYNKAKLIERIETIASHGSKIRLYSEDAEKLVKRLGPGLGTKSLIYFDPPYYEKGQDLYMNYYKPEDHAQIERTIAGLPKHIRWMVSYDNHVEIAKIYRKYSQLTYSLNYSAREYYMGSEIIIFSKNVVPPAPVKPMRSALPQNWRAA